MDHIAKAFNTAADQLATGIAECNAAIDEAEARKASLHRTLAALEVESRKMLEREREADKLRATPTKSVLEENHRMIQETNNTCNALYNELEYGYAAWCTKPQNHNGQHNNGKVWWA